jgi:hypothetical protein
MTVVVVTDANVLINLADIGKLSLLGALGCFDFRVPTEVLAEISEPERRAAVDAALEAVFPEHRDDIEEFVGECDSRSPISFRRSLMNPVTERGDQSKLAGESLIDERGMTWLEHAPKIKLFPVVDARAPYPLSADEQALLFQELPEHLAHGALQGEYGLPRTGSLRPVIGVRDEGARAQHLGLKGAVEEEMARPERFGLSSSAE